MATPCKYRQAEEGRWFLEKDMNCDYLFTISDVFMWVEWVFFLPGDGLLWAVMQSERAAIFLELSPNFYGGWISGILSGFGWFSAFILWVVIMVALEPSQDSN